MAFKKIRLGIPVLALVLGLTVIGCDNGGTPGDDGGDPLPASSGSNALSGQQYFEGLGITTFSATDDGSESGTYTVTSVDAGTYQPGEKFTFNTEIETGSYSWNETSKTVTLKPEKTINGGRPSLAEGGGTSPIEEEIEDNYGPLYG